MGKAENIEKQEQLKDFDALISMCCEIINKQTGKTSVGQEFLYNAEGLSKKIMNHSLTARWLLNPNNHIPNEPKIDFSSIAILTRAALETYLIFHWIFVGYNNEDEKEFRFNCWVLGGLNRTKYKPAYRNHLQKWEREMALAEQTKEKIKATQVYKELKKSNQEKALSGELLTWGWFQLAINAGFNEDFFRKMYMYLSNYAHSNRISIVQIQQINTLDEQHEMGISAIGFLSIVLGKFIYDYVRVMPELNEMVDFNSSQYGLIIQYKIIGESIGNSN